jgi:hypothetical protein
MRRTATLLGIASFGLLWQSNFATADVSPDTKNAIAACSMCDTKSGLMRCLRKMTPWMATIRSGEEAFVSVHGTMDAPPLS